VQVVRFSKWQKTTGTVIGLVESDGSTKGKPDFAPKIEYKTEVGDCFEFIDETASNLKIGDFVEVIHHPEKPQNVRIDSWFKRHEEVWLFAFGLLPFVVFIVIKTTLVLSSWVGRML
jgi:hypothetical protein